MNSLAFMSVENDMKCKIMEKKYQSEINNLKRQMLQKDQELEEYRISLQGMLEEIELIKLNS